LPWAYRNMDPVAAHGSKKRSSSVEGIVPNSCVCAERALADLPEPIEMARLRDEADMVA
jgi:hypothetical protein